VVIVNLAYQLNRAVADKMSKLIHDGGPVYVGRSAGTMIVAKRGAARDVPRPISLESARGGSSPRRASRQHRLRSMEMTAETKPGWLENFSDPSTYKHGTMHQSCAETISGATRVPRRA